MEKWWFNSMLFNRKLEYRCELSKSMDSLGPIENTSLREDPKILTDIEKKIHRDLDYLEMEGFFSSDLNTVSKNDDDHYMYETQFSFNNNITSFIDSCIESFNLGDIDKIGRAHV